MSSTAFPHIAAPLTIGNVTLKNRIVFAPTTMGLSEDAYIKKLSQIAQGEVGLIVIGDVPVQAGHFGHSLYHKKGQDYYRKLADIAHASGAKISAQLHQSDSDFKGMIKYLPKLVTGKIDKGDLRKLLNNHVGEYITGLPSMKVAAITASFGTAAKLAQQVGFDLVQVHGDRMCGSFTSSVFNQRTDCYGGSIENRARFALEAIAAIKQAAPDVPIDYKLAVRQENPHYGNAGVAVEELSSFVPLLEQAGVTSFHVALANHSDLANTIPAGKHPYFGEEGCFLKFCDEVRAHTNLPLCGVGGLTDPAFVEQQLASGRIDCAAMSRQLIADPAWVKKTLAQETNAIQRCTRCNIACIGGMQSHKGVHCIYE